MPLRAAITRLLRTQETFNSLVVQYVNHQHHTISEEHQAMLAELHRYREALQARERRMDTAMHTLLAENAELRTSIGVLQQQVRSDRSAHSVSPARSEAPHTPTTDARDPNEALSASYVGFEDQFRGSPEAIRSRLLEYVP